MYTLYFLPGACSLATQVILRELNQPFELVHRQDAPHFSELNPAGTVPVLTHGRQVYNEGAAIVLELLQAHENPFGVGANGVSQTVLENILFANATMHPAYGRLFFIDQAIANPEAKLQAFNAAAQKINALWAVVEKKLNDRSFLGGETLSPADILLAVYSRWGAFFPVDISIGASTEAMLSRVISRESFQLALKAESEYRVGRVVAEEGAGE